MLENIRASIVHAKGALKGSQERLTQQIDNTPTGDKRNALCDANIALIVAGDQIDAALAALATIRE